MKFTFGNGTYYNNIEDATNVFCNKFTNKSKSKRTDVCLDCPMYIKHVNCLDFASHYPKQAAILMGAEMVPDEEEPKKTHKEYRIEWFIDGKWQLPICDMRFDNSYFNIDDNSFSDIDYTKKLLDNVKKYLLCIQDNTKLRIISREVTEWEVEEDC